MCLGKGSELASPLTDLCVQYSSRRSLADIALIHKNFMKERGFVVKSGFSYPMELDFATIRSTT